MHLFFTITSLVARIARPPPKEASPKECLTRDHAESHKVTGMADAGGAQILCTLSAEIVVKAYSNALICGIFVVPLEGENTQMGAR